MNGTPRLRSAFPTTPQTGNARSTQYGAASPVAKLPTVSSLTTSNDAPAPLIPFDTIDAAQQRSYVFAFYAALLAWRFYDWWNLNQDDAESLWQFMKWVAIDGIFLFGLPALRIPWLEWSSAVMTILFLIHAVIDAMLMFRISIPLAAWLMASTKLFYDREVAISERRVKPADIMNNASLILGRQIIHILPDGSAMLNPQSESFCLGDSRHQVQIPIQINQTNPILIELLRIDLDTTQNETITIGASAAKKMRKDAIKHHDNGNSDAPLLLRYPVKKTGLYLLQKVIDETKLQVQRRSSDAVVVACPRARIRSTGHNRCKGELSDVALEVEGTPPLKLKYRKMANGKEVEASFQSIQPEEFISPSTRQQITGAMVRRGDINVSWARAQNIKVPLNETLTSSGKWIYSVDEVQDALGNIISYASRIEDGDKPKSKTSDLQQAFTVHERPLIVLQGCDSQRPLQVGKGQSIALPIRYGSTGKGPIDSAHTIEYLYTPEDKILPTGEHPVDAQVKQITLKSTQQRPSVQHSGLYTLKSVSTEYCMGEVLEPASCLLQNPPEPELSISTEGIYDKCAGNPIGLRVALDLIGTPPFAVQYTMRKRGDKHHRIEHENLSGLRGQLELTPPEAGHYTYTFTEISDAVYKGYSLREKNLILEQDVKPSASAHFVDRAPRKQACIDKPVSFDVRLQGEGPWVLEYELVHGGKRTKHKIKDVESERYTIHTDRLTNGGEYTLALASITDKMGCKEFLKEEARISVRHQRPKASFGQIEGNRRVRTLEGKKVQLPLRLVGEAPWTVSYNNIDDPSSHVRSKKIQHANDWLEVSKDGTYDLSEVHDSVCPGSVDELANRFEVSWIPRPGMKVQESSLIKYVGDKYIKGDVCEGDEDAFEIILTGTPPYDVKYEEHYRPEQGARFLRNKEINAALGVASVRMETGKAGIYEYRFVELGDANYDHDPKRHTPLVVQQHVNPRPTARFTHPGKTYSYCTIQEDGEEVIPVTFTGIPPFHIEIEIRHHGSARPEVVSIPNIPSHSHDLRIPHRLLHLGHSNLAIRKVRDARGCQGKPDPVTSPRVQVSVHDAPAITPLESQEHYCVGDRLSFALQGSVPFTVFYTFEGVERKASSPGTTFRRIAEKPGTFTITGIKDSASDCRASTSITKYIHALPSVKVSKGRETVVDIHEGGEAEILFEFGGTPPFEFTYTRSTNVKKGRKSQVLETKTGVSYEYSMRVRASEEGTYEVVAIRDKFCAVARQGGEVGAKGQKLLTY